MEYQKSNNRGITLIALVITIIVLLILAGITIMALTGENGILTRATEAKKATELANIKEQIKVDLLTAQSQKTGNMDLTENEINGVLSNGSYKDNLEQTDGSYIMTDESRVQGINITTSGETTFVTLSELYSGSVAVWKCNYATGVITRGNVTLNIGDTIAYDPTAGVTDTSKLSYTSPTGTYVSADYAFASETVEQGSGYSSTQAFSASDYTGKWRVLGVDGNGQLLIMSDANVQSTDSANYCLRGQTGATWGVEELNNICAIFGHGTGATGARSITVDDINKITGYNPEYEGINTNTTEITDSTTKAHCDAGKISEYGNEVTSLWKGTNNPYYSGTNGKTITSTLDHSSYGFNWIDNTTKTGYTSPFSSTATASAMEKITTLLCTRYYYYPNSLTTSSTTSDSNPGISTSSAAYDMVFNDGSGSFRRYWLADEVCRNGIGR